MTNEYLRHTLSTINYRFRKSVKRADADFGAFSLGNGSRTPGEILHHMHHVLKATRIFIEEESRSGEKPNQLGFEDEIARFLEEVKTLDKVLSLNELPVNYAKKTPSGPLVRYINPCRSNIHAEQVLWYSHSFRGLFRSQYCDGRITKSVLRKSDTGLN